MSESSDQQIQKLHFVLSISFLKFINHQKKQKDKNTKSFMDTQYIQPVSCSQSSFESFSPSSSTVSITQATLKEQVISIRKDITNLYKSSYPHSIKSNPFSCINKKTALKYVDKEQQTQKGVTCEMCLSLYYKLQSILDQKNRLEQKLGQMENRTTSQLFLFLKKISCLQLQKQNLNIELAKYRTEKLNPEIITHQEKETKIETKMDNKEIRLSEQNGEKIQIQKEKNRKQIYVKVSSEWIFRENSILKGAIQHLQQQNRKKDESLEDSYAFIQELNNRIVQLELRRVQSSIKDKQIQGDKPQQSVIKEIYDQNGYQE